jgi:CO/xanthine dehydrogenase Mo-binding subunit
MDDMAAELGIDPLDFRMKNAAEEGDPMGNNQKWPNIGLKQCLELAKEHPLWKNRPTNVNEGVGLAVGAWPCFMGPAASVCRVDSDGTIKIHVGSVDISGVNSSFVLVAAEELGVHPDQIQIIQGDTDSGPYAPNSGGSQVTYSVAGAVAGAAREVKQKLLDLAADHFEARVDDLEMKEGQVRVKGVPDRSITIAELASMAQSQANGPGPIVGQGHTAIGENAPGFVVHMVKVEVDPNTGHVQPTAYVSIQDVGFALNPTMVDGQIHGGVVQGLGYALHEAMVYSEDGQLLTGSFMDYDIPKANTVPNIESIRVNNPSPHGPYGARGIGEPPIIAGGAAVANAIKNATGVRITELPIRGEVLWRALHGNGQ